MTDGGRAVADFDGRVERNAGTDRVEPVFQVRASDVAGPFPFFRHGRVGTVRDQSRRIGLEVVAAHFQDPLFAVKNDEVGSV